MKHSNLILSIIAMLSSTWACAQGYSLSGQVMDGETKEYIIGAPVMLTGMNQHVLTDERGRYTFHALDLRTYTIAIDYIGYEHYQSDVKSGDRVQSELHIHELKAGIFELRAVNVTADPELQAQIISAIDIKLRTTNTSQDILSMVPGLFIAQHAGGGKAEQIFLRGFDIDHGTDIAVSADGMPVNMVSHAHGQGYADLHFLIPETIDRVHFGKGPYHTHVGNMATAGYVGFQTRNRLDENTLSFQVDQFNSYRTLGMFKLLDQHDERSSRNAYIAGEYFTSEGYFESPQGLNRKSLFGKFTGTLGKDHVLTFSASNFASRWNASGQIPLRAVKSGLIGFYGSIDDTEGGYTSRSNINLQLSSTLDPQSWIKNQVFYSKYDFELFSNFTFFLLDSIHGDQIKQSENRHLIGYNGSYSRLDEWFGMKWKTESGVQFRKDISLDNALSRTADRTTVLSQVSAGDIRESNVGVYLNEVLSISSRLSINAGLRLDHFDFVYHDHLDGNAVRQISENILSPKLNVYLKITDQLQLFCNMGYGFHSNDTRVVIAQHGLLTLPRAFGMDLGALWMPIPDIILTGSLWRLDLDQEFIYVGDAGIVEPSGRTKRVGVEFSGRWQIWDWLFLDTDVNYTIARSRDDARGMDFIPLAPRFSGIGGLTWTAGKRWSGNIRYRHLGNRPANEDQSTIAEGYQLTDLLVSYKLKKYEIGISIQNVFNVKWYEAQFDTESRLQFESTSTSEIHFTPGTPLNFRANFTYNF